MVEPDEFLKHNGDDGFKVTHIGYLPESLSEDTTAWLKMGLTLDAIGNADNDPGSAWDVSGIAEATRYYILSRNCLLYTSPSPRDSLSSRMPSSA